MAWLRPPASGPAFSGRRPLRAAYSARHAWRARRVGIGAELAAALQNALRHHALPFAKQIGQQALVGNGDVAGVVGDGEGGVLAVALDQRARLNEAANAQARARRKILLQDFGRTVEEDDAVAQRVKRQRGGAGDDAERDADQGERLPRRVTAQLPSPNSRASASRSRPAAASPAIALRASAIACLALSVSCSTQ